MGYIDKARDKAFKDVLSMGDGYICLHDEHEKIRRLFKLYKDEKNRLLSDGISYIGCEEVFIFEFEVLLQKYIIMNVITEEWAHIERKRLYERSSKSPSFREWILGSGNPFID